MFKLCTNIFPLVIFLSFLFRLAASNSCTDLCDLNNKDSGPAIKLCGTDYVSHETYFDAVENDYCYAVCGVMSQYEGLCHCPNDCMSSAGQGTCSATKQLCECNVGWTGNDCSLPSAESKCSYHGTLVTGGSKDSKFPFNYCQCDNGWTGTDCSSPALNIGNAPWGTIFKNIEPYSKSDTYKDEHPVFNISVFATIRIQMDEKDYVNLLLPENLYNESYAPVNLFFDNGNVQESYYNVGFRVKGAYSRMDQKKGWVIKFNEFTKNQLLINSIKKIGLKSGSVDDDTLVKTKLFGDFVRAVGVPTQRSSYALLYVNDIFLGVYYMHEDIAPEFITARIADDTGKGNMMKYFWNVHLGYYGDNVTYYQTRAHINELGVPMYYYEQSDGNGDWTDFIQWIYYFNTTHGDAFASSIANYVDIDMLLHAMVVESFMLGSDNMASGANYFTYHLQPSSSPSSSKNTKWILFDADFDECFVFDPVTHEPEVDPDIFTFFLTTPQDHYDDQNPLVNQLLALPTYANQYVRDYATFVNTVFGSDSVQQPTVRYAALMQFLAPWIARDRYWQMSFGMTSEEFILDAEQSIANLSRRYQDIMQQIERYAAQT